jgi:2-polyprenyl-3-methyl-5-hydroxy-6-metoxy-1,4-benzoquinol methylase
MKEFDLYSKENIHFIERSIPLLLKEAIEDTSPKILVDIGCGDGRVIVPLAGRYQKTLIIGMDFSFIRLKRARSECAHLSLIQANANVALPFKLEMVNFVVCSQMIEHLNNDQFLLKQLHTILSQKGTLFLSTVFKKQWAWWIYKAQGKRVCDPTHVYEYESQQELLDRIIAAGLTVQQVRIVPFRISILRNLVRVMVKYGVVHEKKARDIMANTLFRALARHVFCPVPGYRIIEVICQKKRGVSP